ncbi:hypothetical protein ACFYS8_06535 [Kitasatospora sp. NPDC004615]|uniref:hypothetical protein n=1 Tax=Kitasatospora sp. NPDC004615 TaxID=3364017 RepID=UPI0036779575
MDALTGLLAVQHRSVPVVVHRFTNADGDYYSADPDFHPDGRSTALNIYPATGKRRRSGYTDATRRDQWRARVSPRRMPVPSMTTNRFVRFAMWS